LEKREKISRQQKMAGKCDLIFLNAIAAMWSGELEKK
jgi:hypothetical protein